MVLLHQWTAWFYGVKRGTVQIDQIWPFQDQYFGNVILFSMINSIQNIKEFFFKHPLGAIYLFDRMISLKMHIVQRYAVCTTFVTLFLCIIRTLTFAKLCENFYITMYNSHPNFWHWPLISSLLIVCTLSTAKHTYGTIIVICIHNFKHGVTPAGHGIDYSGHSCDSRTPIMMPWCSGSNTYLSVLTRYRLRSHIVYTFLLFPVGDAPGRVCFPLIDVIVLVFQ